MAEYKVFLALGSNQGNKSANLRNAISRIGKEAGPVVRQSSVYVTEPWGVENQEDYYNQVIEIRSEMEPRELMKTILAIESALGRERKEKWAPRTIDIDILFFDELKLDLPGLTIPHPRLHQRNFVLVPLMEIAPELIHPTLDLSVEELYWNSGDESEVLLLEK